MVHRLEELNKTNNGKFRFRVWSMIMLGYAAVHILWICSAVLLYFICWAIYDSFVTGHLEILLLAKFLVVGVLGLVGLLLMVVRLLFYQPPLPPGFEITEKDAPQLFAVLEELRQKLDCGHFSHVYLNTELNASVVYIPHLMGLLPGETNLVIGLPLLASFSVEETKAILAHEIGHMMKGHGAFGAWVYRNRLMWIGLGTYIQRTGGMLSGPASVFFQWYVPQISAYSLVSSREFEYQADQLSVQAAGKNVTARALLLIHTLAIYCEEHFREEMREKTKTFPTVPEGLFHEMLETIRKVRESGELNEFTMEALAKHSDIFETHPSLANRLLALKPEELPDLTCSGEVGLSLLKDSWDAILPLSEIVLQKQLGKQWADAHTEHLKDAIILKRIHSVDNPPNKWNPAQVLEYVKAARRSSDFETAWDWVNHYIELQPDEAIGFLIRGQMGFERRHDCCLDDFRRAAVLSPKTAIYAYRKAIVFAERYRPGSDTAEDREALHQAELRQEPHSVDV